MGRSRRSLCRRGLGIASVSAASAGEKPAEFKMILKARPADNHRGGAGFATAKGRGYIELKCLAPEAGYTHITATAWVGDPDAQPPVKPHGGRPVTHDFKEKAICAVPDEKMEWKFGPAVDRSDRSFLVVLEMMPASRTDYNHYNYK